MAIKLLVVEDTPILLDGIVFELEEAGYTVDAAISFTAAFEFITAAPPPTYAAVLSDYNLGGRQTGANVFQAAWRALRPLPPLIASSSEMKYWNDYVKTFNLHLVPKLSSGWDAKAILAKLTELNIRP